MGKGARERAKRRAKKKEAESSTFDLEHMLAAFGGSSGHPSVDDAAYPTTDGLLAAVIDQYLTSPEFNGLPVGTSADAHEHVKSLVTDGLIQVVSQTDYMNTHIRPWVRDDTSRQLADLEAIVSGDSYGCLNRPGFRGGSFSWNQRSLAPEFQRSR